MSTSNCLASTCGSCRYCRYFTPEGRRGGHCEQLGVPVQSKWTACMLALPPFAPSWETLEQSVVWQSERLMVKKQLTLASTWNSTELKDRDDQNLADRAQQDVRPMAV